MLNTIYANSTQFNQLLDAIQGGDTTAIVTALNDIKDSIDNISGGGSPIEIDNTQWQDLLDEIDNTDIVNALSSVGLNNTQWNNLVNAITNQQISVSLDLNNVNTDNTYNHSNFSNQYVTGVLNQIYNTLFTLDTNIIQWVKITSFSLVDVYLFKIGIIKFLWLDTAKTNIPTGWISGGVGTLPTSYASILNPSISVNKSYRTGVMTINVNNNGVLNFNCNSSIASGSYIRVLYIYI